MMRKTISDAISNISTRHIEEAAEYSAKGKAHKPVWMKLGAAAACLALALIVVGTLVPFHGDVVSAYAYETNEEITAAGVVMDTGTIRSSGEMTGHPLMFYLSGKDIETVRFSCKNQQLSFMDWTEKRDEYANAQNFTVTYGEDESEYYYLTIDWVPNTTIRELTDHAEVSIEDLPAELREDVIVMEITFANGKTATKAITISLLDNGTFFAAFDDYEISEADTFVKRPDNEAIPHDTLNSQGSEMINNKTEASDEAAENIITFDGTIVENTIDTLAYVILVEPGGNEIPYDAVFFELPDQEADWVLQIGEEVTITCLDTFTEQAPHFGTLISITEQETYEEQDDYAKAEGAARAYYADTVFEVISMELKDQTEEEISFSVRVSKGGIVQDPDRTIFLRLVNGVWEVVNEGY